MAFLKHRSRAWCCTIFNLEEYPPLAARDDILTLVVGEEICPDTKRVHYQGYVRFNNVVRGAALKKLAPTSHWEVRRGSEDQAIAYCRKDGKLVADRVSEVPEVDGKDNIPERVTDMIRDGATNRQIWDAYPVFFMYNMAKINAVKTWLKSDCPEPQYKKPRLEDPV